MQTSILVLMLLMRFSGAFTAGQCCQCWEPVQAVQCYLTSHYVHSFWNIIEIGGMSHTECEFHEGRIFLTVIASCWICTLNRVSAECRAILFAVPLFRLLPINFSFKYKCSLSKDSSINYMKFGDFFLHFVFIHIIKSLKHSHYGT